MALQVFITITLLVGLSQSAPLKSGAGDDACGVFDTKTKCLDDTQLLLDCVWVPISPGVDDEALYHCAAKSCDTLTLGGADDEGAECKATPACTFDEATQYCTTKGTDPPCELYYADPSLGEDCPTRCDYSTEAEKCIDKGAKVRCGEIYDKDGCASSPSECVFYASIYKCWEKALQIPCSEYEYFEQSLCPDYCKWVVTNNGAGSDGTCVSQDEEAACEDFTFDSQDGEDCPSPRCKWYPIPINECVSAVRDVPCSDLPGKLCAPEGRCKWFPEDVDNDGAGGTCDECPGGKTDCIEDPPEHGTDDDSTVGPDGGKPCNSFAGETVWDCPEPRCALEDSSDTSGCGATETGATCNDASCVDMMFEEDSCKKLKTCTFDANTGICSENGKPFPCAEIFGGDECTAKEGCSWQAMASANEIGQEGLCYNTGGQIACKLYLSGSDCPADHCKWAAGADTCYEKDVHVPCRAYGNEGECPPEFGCAFVDGICWEEGRSPSCSDFCTPGQCRASGKCQFDNSIGICEKCGGGGCPVLKSCSTYTTEETCPQAKCQFVFDDPGPSGIYEKGTCTDKVCSELDDEVECNAHAVTPLCAWDGYVCEVQGFAAPCDKYWNSDGCVKNGCTWDHADATCDEKDGEVPCEQFTEDQCGQGDAVHCEMKHWECEHKTSLDPSTVPPLDGKGDGRGNEYYGKCTSTLWAQVKEKIENAETECIDWTGAGEGKGATEAQVRCLAYFLGEAPDATTITAACPCLWFYGTEVSPNIDHWMLLNC